MPTAYATLPAGPSVVHYSITGSGPGLVLVHGTAASADIWDSLTAAVSDRFTVIAPNLSGSGATTDPGGPLSVDDLAKQVIATVEAAGTGPMHLVGQSLGAVVSAAVAASRPDLVAGLVLVSGWNTTDTRGHALFDLWARILAAGPELFARLLVMTGPRPEFYELLGPAGLEDLVRTITGLIPAGTQRQIAVDHTVAITALLPAITAPTLVVGCTYDQMIPVEHQRAQAAAIAGARYQQVPAGHMFPLELPELFAATITDFVGGGRSVPAVGVPAVPAVSSFPVLPQRELGAGGPLVGAIGFGAMGMSWAYADAVPDSNRYLRVLRHAIDAGATLIDTADLYGPHTNEELVGRAIAGRRDDVVLATKGGLVADDPAAWAIHRDGRPEHLRAALDASLRRLGVDHVDLYYLHRVDETIPLAEQWGALADLVAAGKARLIGLSEVTVDQLDAAHAHHPVAAVQSELSLWTGEHAPAVAWAAEHGTAFVAYAPLGRGYFAGAHTPATAFASTDLRAVNPRFTAEALRANEQLLNAVHVVAARHGATSAQIALAWVLAQGKHVIPIPGTKHRERVTENLAGAFVRLTDEDLHDLNSLPEAAGGRY